MLTFLAKRALSPLLGGLPAITSRFAPVLSVCSFATSSGEKKSKKGKRSKKDAETSKKQASDVSLNVEEQEGIQALKENAWDFTRGGLSSSPLRLHGRDARYAHALFAAAEKSDLLEDIEQDLNSMKELMGKSAAFEGFLKDPTIPRLRKKEGIFAVCDEAKNNSLTKQFFGVLADNGRLSATPKIIDAYNTLMADYRGEVRAVVTTAEPMSKMDETELNLALQNFLEPDQVLKLETKVDPTILGGLVVDIGDKHLDLSIQGRIQTFSNLLQQAL